MTKVEEVKLGTLELAITCMLAETTSHPLQVRQMGQDSFMMTHNGVRALVFYHRMLDWGHKSKDAAASNSPLGCDGGSGIREGRVYEETEEMNASCDTRVSQGNDRKSRRPSKSLTK